MSTTPSLNLSSLVLFNDHLCGSLENKSLRIQFHETEGPLREHSHERNFKSIECYHVSNLKQWHESFCNPVINT